MVTDIQQKFAALKAGHLLPSPQGVALAIASLALREDVGTPELTRLIKTDPAIAGRILRYANTAYAGSQRPIASLTQAVIFLGLYRIRQLALAFSLVDLYRSGRCAGFDYERYWSQSLAAGISTQELCRFAKTSPEDGFSCGLLAAIGRLGLASAYPVEYAAILARPLDAAGLRRHEALAFGLDHTMLAGEMLTDWGLPAIYADAVRHHEDPDNSPFAVGSRAENMAHVLNLSALIARALTASAATVQHNDDDAQALYHGAARIGLDAGELAPTMERIHVLWLDWAKELRLPAPQHSIADMLTSAPNDAASSALLPMRIVLLAASPALLRTLSEWLQRLGQQVLVVNDWASLASTVRAESPDILLVDLRAGNTDPVAAVHQIRQAEAPYRGFLLSLVAAADEALVTEQLHAGIDDYLLLPPTEIAFRARLHAAQRVVTLQSMAQAERAAAIRHSSEWARSNQRLLHEALTDVLTQLPNRRYGMDHLTQECALADISKRPLACIMLDIDHFKRVNDMHGHAAGDQILCQIARTVQANLRRNDVVFRYGGEEFCICCPETSAADALGLAERILQAVRSTAYLGARLSLNITISAGIAVRPSGRSDVSALIAQADAELYRAKAGGRNRACVRTLP